MASIKMSGVRITFNIRTIKQIVRTQYEYEVRVGTKVQGFHTTEGVSVYIKQLKKKGYKMRDIEVIKL